MIRVLIAGGEERKYVVIMILRNDSLGDVQVGNLAELVVVKLHPYEDF